MNEVLISTIFEGNLLIAIAVAAIAGLVSFFSPCVIPLVPGYLSYATGMVDNQSKSRLLIGSSLFVSGFTILFVVYGLFFGKLGSLVLLVVVIVAIVICLLLLSSLLLISSFS